MATKRLFLAIPIPIDIQDYLIQLMEDFTIDDLYRWTPRENLHATVNFLGEIPDEEITEVQHKLTHELALFKEFSLKFKEMHTIYKGKAANMIWILFDESKEFEQLVHHIGEALELKKEVKPYPHITLSRIREAKNNPPDLPEREPVQPLYLRVHELQLCESELTLNGANYTQLTTLSLLKDPRYA